MKTPIVDVHVAAFEEEVLVPGHRYSSSVRVPVGCEDFDYSREWKRAEDAVREWSVRFWGGHEFEDQEEGPTVSGHWSEGHSGIVWEGTQGDYVAAGIELLELGPGRWIIYDCWCFADVDDSEI